MDSEIDRLLHDADRKVMGANFAQQMHDVGAAVRLAREAVKLYRKALDRDPELKDPAWKEGGNRDEDWLRRNGFQRIAAVSSENQA